MIRSQKPEHRLLMKVLPTSQQHTGKMCLVWAVRKVLRLKTHAGVAGVADAAFAIRGRVLVHVVAGVELYAWLCRETLHANAADVTGKLRKIGWS